MKKIKKLVFFSGFAVCSGLGMIYTKTYLNTLHYLNRLKEEKELKDSTRPDYQYFGLNWGANSDQQLLDDSDTGDFLFSSIDCAKLFDVGEMAQCFKNEVMQLGFHQESNLAGVLLRDSEEVYVIYSYFGKVAYSKYADFINLGFHK